MHKLIELQKIIEERIGSLTEEVEIATNVQLNPLYIADRILDRKGCRIIINFEP